MEYGEKIMRKYGWQKGKGLGRDEKGDPKPLKASLKFDKAGIGYNEKVSHETANPWWVKGYNEAASKKTSSSKQKSKSKSSDEGIQMNFNNLTDEELFAACGGRTAHKAARHGLKLSGKLERIRKQEILATSGHQVVEENEELPAADVTSPKKSKSRKKVDTVEEISENPLCPSEDLETSNENKVSRKKRKKNAKDDEDRTDDTCISKKKKSKTY